MDNPFQATEIGECVDVVLRMVRAKLHCLNISLS